VAIIDTDTYSRIPQMGHIQIDTINSSVSVYAENHRESGGQVTNHESIFFSFRTITPTVLENKWGQCRLI